MTTATKTEEKKTLRQKLDGSMLGFRTTRAKNHYVKRMLPSAFTSVGYLAMGYGIASAFRIGKGTDPMEVIPLGILLVVGGFVFFATLLYVLARILEQRDWNAIEKELEETYGPRGEDGVRRKV